MCRFEATWLATWLSLPPDKGVEFTLNFVLRVMAIDLNSLHR